MRRRRRHVPMRIKARIARELAKALDTLALGGLITLNERTRFFGLIRGRHIKQVITGVDG